MLITIFHFSKSLPSAAMTHRNIDDPPDEFFVEAIFRLKFFFMRLARSAFISMAAIIMAGAQPFFHYSIWKVGVICLVLGSFNRTAWISVVILVWLAILFFAPPETATIASQLLTTADLNQK